VVQDQTFKGRQFTAEVILWAVRWYLMFPISYRDLELMLSSDIRNPATGDIENPATLVTLMPRPAPVR